MKLLSRPAFLCLTVAFSVAVPHAGLGQVATGEARLALVIALRGQMQEPGQSAADALAVSQAALAAGFDVRRMEYPAALPPPPATPADVTLIYLSGESAANQDLGQIITDWSDAGPLILVVETCPAADVGLPEPLPNMLIAAPFSCEGMRLTEGLTTALAAPGQELGQQLMDHGFNVDLGANWTGFTPISTAPVDSGPVVSAPPSVADAVIIPVAAAAPFIGDRAARPTAAGLPEPSVIVGDDPRPAGIPPTDSIAGQALGTGFAERQQIRADDPQLFASLLTSGAFDPAEADLAEAIQAELRRMDCYRGEVDGLWGAGSRAALDRYHAAAGGDAASVEPEIALFRALAAADVRCPPPAPAVAQPRSQPATVTPARRTPAASGQAVRQQPAPQRAQPAQPAQPTQPARRIDPNAIGSGVFR